MASLSPPPAQPVADSHDNHNLPLSDPPDSNSYIGQATYEVDFDNYMPSEEGTHNPNDNIAGYGMPASSQNGLDSELVNAEADTNERSAAIGRIKSEMAEEGENFTFDMIDLTEASLQTSPAARESFSPVGTYDFSKYLQQPGQQNDGRVLDFGSNVLERHLTFPRHDTPAMAPPVEPDPGELDAEFQRHKHEYNRKKKAGTLTTALDIEYIKAKAAYDARQRKIAADRRADEEDSPNPDSESGLFVSETEEEEPTDQSQSWSAMHCDDEDERAIPQAARRQSKRKFIDDNDSTTTTTTTAPRKTKRAQKSKAVNTDVDVDDVLEKVKARKKNSKSNAKTKRDGRSKNCPDVPNQHSMLGMATNVFRDTEANASLGEQPTFDNTTRKADALKQLIASVPHENRKIAAADKRFLDEACKTFAGTGVVKAAPDGNWLVKGMRSTLKHYQVLGTAFMRKRESELLEPRGGILADEMGLGKTVMMLANIINGRQTSRDKDKPTCTLIVASPALCNQWDTEIRNHTLSKSRDRGVEHAKKHGFGLVVQHRANHRISQDKEEVQRRIAEADICLTTYGDICKSYPKAPVPMGLTTARQKDAWWTDHYQRHKGVFHRVKFLRIVLDEAQSIKNHMGHTSLACRALQATHYWAITGTPVMNRLTEFYPYFKFLREPHTGSFKIFKENFCTPDDPDGTARLAVFLRKIMIRRTHLDTLFGARLLDLPQPKQTVVWLKFNETERQIYEIVKTRFIQRINTIAREEGGVTNHYNHIWTMILRLRQLCAHTLLIQDTIMDLLKREDFEKLNALCQREANEGEGRSILLQLRSTIAKSAARQMDVVEAGAGGISTTIESTETAPILAMDFDNSNLHNAGGRHGLTYNFGKYMKNLAESSQFEAIEDRSLCSACRSRPSNPYVTSCYHIYCYTCLEELQHYAARNGKDQAACIECGSDYTSVEPCQVSTRVDYDESTAGSEAGSFASTVTGGKKGKGRKKSPKKDDMNDWIGLKGEVLPSTKTIACKAQVLEWLQADPSCKIIIYTQFMPVIRILAKVCATERWNYVCYKGDMSQDARDKSIKKFAADKQVNIMLCSLRCGGLGLNLTMAQHVILIDPWWNAAVEQQAFCRVFRIGQTKETRMTRFVVENTIDSAMMAMKQRKEDEIDKVMDNPRLSQKLTIEELMRMFGEVRTDEGGRPFIFADNVGQEDHELLREEDDENEDFLVNDF